MTELHKIGVRLTDEQKKLVRAMVNKEEITLRIPGKNLTGKDSLMVPMNDLKRLQKKQKDKKGMQIKITKSNIRKQTGSGSPRTGRTGRGGPRIGSPRRRRTGKG